MASDTPEEPREVRVSVVDPIQVERYREGVDLLLRGKAEDAIRLLGPLASAEDRPAMLALAKAYLECGDGDAAAAPLAALLADEPDDPGLTAYIHLLSASAASFGGRPEDAERHLHASMATDPRLERAVRALRRRIRDGEPPHARL